MLLVGLAEREAGRVHVEVTGGLAAGGRHGVDDAGREVHPRAGRRAQHRVARGDRQLPVEDVPRYATELIEFLKTKHSDLLPELKEKKEMKPEIQARLDKALDEFGGIFQPTGATRI